MSEIESYLARWNNSTSANIYDWAIAGIPFLAATSKEYPYVRESLDNNKQQFNTSKDVGEQALGNWWYRSQSSFDLGAGARFTDTGNDPKIARRFFDSCGVDAITIPGQVTLLDKLSPTESIAEGPNEFVPIAWTRGRIGAFTFICDVNLTEELNIPSNTVTGGNGTGAVFNFKTIKDTEDGLMILRLNIYKVGVDYEIDDILTFSFNLPSGTIATITITVTEVSELGDFAAERNIKGMTSVVSATNQAYCYFNGSEIWEQYANDGVNDYAFHHSFAYNILDVTSNGPDLYVLCEDGIYRIISLNEYTIERILDFDKAIKDQDKINTGVIEYIKDRLVFALNTTDNVRIYQSATTTLDSIKSYIPTSIEWVPTVYTNKSKTTVKYPSAYKYTFDKKIEWKKGQQLTKISGSPISEFNFSSPVLISAVYSDKLAFKINSNDDLSSPYNNKSKDLTNETRIIIEHSNEAIEIYSNAGFSNVTSISDGPRGIYFTLSNRNKSVVLFSTIGIEEQNDVPRLKAPIIVGELPTNEYINTSISYLSTYLILGTNRGVRVCLIDSQGSLIIGPLTVQSDTEVKALAVFEDFCYATGASVEPNRDKIYLPALYKISLNKTTEDNSLFFAYQKDVSVNTAGMLYNTDSNINSIYIRPNPYAANPALSENPIITLSTGTHIWECVNRERVERGWLRTGKIRLDTAEDKIFQYLKLNFLPLVGAIVVAYQGSDSEDFYGGNQWYAIEQGSRILELPGTVPEGSPQEMKSHQFISYDFELVRGQATEEDPEGYQKGPTLLGYQVKANPANIKNSVIRLPLLAMNKERGTSGSMIERPVFDRLSVLESAEQLGKVVLFQDFGTGEERRVIIDKTQFISNIIPESKTASDRAGIILLTLRTVDINTNTAVDGILGA